MPTHLPTHLLVDYVLFAVACLSVVVAFGVNDARLARQGTDAKTIDGLAETAARLTSERDTWVRVADAERHRAERIAAVIQPAQDAAAVEALISCTRGAPW